MYRAEVLTWQWDSELSGRFHEWREKPNTRTSVTFSIPRHPIGRCSLCHANQGSWKSIAMLFVGSCRITWRTISRLSSDSGLRTTLRTAVTARLSMTVCGMYCGCWATKRPSNYPQASANVCTGDCFRSSELSSCRLDRSLQPDHLSGRAEGHDFQSGSFLHLRVGLVPF